RHKLRRQRPSDGGRGEEIEHGAAEERERERRRRDDDLLDAERGEVLDAFADPVRRAGERTYGELLERPRVERSSRRPSPQRLVARDEVALVLADERVQAEGAPERRRIPPHLLARPCGSARSLRIFIGRPLPHRVPAAAISRGEPERTL